MHIELYTHNYMSTKVCKLLLEEKQLGSGKKRTDKFYKLGITEHSLVSVT